MAQQAMDVFNVTIGGVDYTVTKGEVLPEGHPILQHLGDDVGNLFRPLQEDAPPKPAAKAPRAAKGST